MNMTICISAIGTDKNGGGCDEELHFGQNKILEEDLNSLNSLIKNEVKKDVE